MMLKVGVTGGIGSGKTTVCKVFELLGIPVFYADDVAKSIMHTDQVLKTAILNTFGERAYNKEGTLNRSYISSLVFNSKPELEKLNSLVHPAVFRAFDNWLLQQKDAPYVIKEAALLFESDSYKMCDESILVIAPTETKISRVKLRDGISDEDVKLRMNRQFSDEVKIKFADHILNNDEKQLIIPKIIQLHQQFLTIRS
ncbi:MAG: dephospho-CoA kinase [Sphingobacterium thalpophilum]